MSIQWALEGNVLELETLGNAWRSSIDSFSSLHRIFDLLHHDSMCSPKLDEEIQKFHHISSSTYTSKLSKTKEGTWSLKGTPKRRGQAGPQQTNLLMSTAQAQEGVPTTPPHWQAPIQESLWLDFPPPSGWIDSFAWLQDHHITTPHLRVTWRWRDGLQRVWDLDTERPGFAF